MAKIKKFRVKIELDGQEIITEVIGQEWTDVCDYVFGNIEVKEIDKKGVEI